MVAKANKAVKIAIKADYDREAGESAREWYARRSAEWAQGPDYWMERRIENFSRAIRNMKEVI